MASDPVILLSIWIDFLNHSIPVDPSSLFGDHIGFHPIFIEVGNVNIEEYVLGAPVFLDKSGDPQGEGGRRPKLEIIF